MRHTLRPLWNAGRRGRWDLAVGVAVLAFATAAGSGSAEAPAETKEAPGEITLTQHLDRDKLRPGRKTRWEIRVEGWRKPVEVRLHNFSPGVVRLRGGPDQIVKTSGGRNNRLRRRVTGLAPGVARLDVWIHRREPRARGTDLAERIAPRLAEIEAELAQRSQKLREASSETLSGERFGDLLAETEKRLLSVLDFPELTALRDYVRQAFSALRTERLDTARRPAGGIRLATLRALRSSALDAASGPSTTSVLDRLADLLRSLVRRADNRDLLLDLCIVSEPEGATLRLHPLSAPNRSRTLATSAALPNVWRGLYAYRLKAPGHRGIDCARGQEPVPAPCPLDLMGDSRTVFRCDLTPVASRSHPPSSSCRRLEGWSEECGDHGR